ncbi:MAG TPA: acyltransferase [Bacteroidetes bacterium]|jgi:glycerol-3-phosphate O-acyltransferase|nr:MAG: hypothetical protein ABR94_02410 [Sphingobacteriales bacterium BACL12 MAG-120802-bin5]KRP13163.1 MAG: hypothetical protein ABR95_07045 [Sphingobacteriales bacterium BACL12 MAG-120813-bin55]HCK22652.1 acyltransferase [Bacteroidota bacterium]
MDESNGNALEELFPQILPSIDDWPISRISKARKEIIAEVTEKTLQSILSQNGEEKQLQAVLAKAVYMEKSRINGKAWSVDPKDDKEFWGNVQKKLVELEAYSDGKIDDEKEILRNIIERYVSEIAGHFDKNTYRFANRFVPFAFNRLLNSTRSREFVRLFRNKKNLLKRIHLVGETEQVRNLAQKGTVIVVPTHISNIDSITIGWAISAIGLPAFLYGAGLNLFSVRFLAYFMKRLGAYKVDRRKKNSIYLETLKMYSTVVIAKGGHSLFFPGGTRSRSGELEKSLKLGLLGTALEAQRQHIVGAADDHFEKIFVVPVTLNYSFVIEAPLLIDEHLKNVGKERYFVQADRYSSSYKLVRFLVKFFTASADFTIAFGKPMDIFGNKVNEDGLSLDAHGAPIDIRDYFKSKGQLREDQQRDSEYIRMLSESIVQSFKVNNVAMPAHIVAFTAFSLLEKIHHTSDLYSILRMPAEFRRIPYNQFRQSVQQVQEELVRLEEKEDIRLGALATLDSDELIKYGTKSLGIYHAKKTLLIDKKTKDIICQDMKTLLFYHNRLKGYGLEKFV